MVVVEPAEKRQLFLSMIVLGVLLRSDSLVLDFKPDFYDVTTDIFISFFALSVKPFVGVDVGFDLRFKVFYLIILIFGFDFTFD